MTYVDLDDVKAQLDIDTYRSTHDVQLSANLASAIEAVSRYTGDREFLEAGSIEESTRMFDTGLGARAYIDDVTSITKVEESNDNVTWSERTDYWLWPLHGSPATAVESLIPFRRFVRVTGKFGYGSVPAVVVDATILYAISLFDRRNSPSGLVAGGEFGPIRISRRTDPTVAELLDPLVRVDRTIGIA